MRFTPQSGRRSVAADTKSFPYFFSKISRIAVSSGISEHRGAENIKLDIPSLRSGGHSLKKMEPNSDLNDFSRKQKKYGILYLLSLSNDGKSCHNQFTEELNELVCSQNILFSYNMFNLQTHQI